MKTLGYLLDRLPEFLECDGVCVKERFDFFWVSFADAGVDWKFADERLKFAFL